MPWPGEWLQRQARIKDFFPREDESSTETKQLQTAPVAKTGETRLAGCFDGLLDIRPLKEPWFVKSGRAGRWRIRLEAPRDSLIASYLDGGEVEADSLISARAWIENFDWHSEWTIREEVRRVADQTWLVLLSELPDPDDDPDLVEREAEEELEQRRMSFRRY